MMQLCTDSQPSRCWHLAHPHAPVGQAARPGEDGGHRVGAGLVPLLVLAPVAGDGACTQQRQHLSVSGSS
jgi:hypothetical protein